MTTYVALLRAINVSGRNKIPMADLRALFSGLGHDDVTTYLQSGNVVFHTKRAKTHDLAERDRGTHRGRDLGLEVPVLVRTQRELEILFADNPFAGPRVDPKTLHAVFLEERAAARAFADLDLTRYEPDELSVHGQEIYLSCPGGYGTTKLDNAFFERRLGTRATTRNWRTITSLVELAQG